MEEHVIARGVGLDAFGDQPVHGERLVHRTRHQALENVGNQAFRGQSRI